MNNTLRPSLLLLAFLPVAQIAAQTSALQKDEIVALPTFDVSASKVVGYGTTNALGATRVNLAIKDTSHSIVILNRELMDDLGTLDGLDILKYASGVGPASTRTTNVVTIRGEEIRPSSGANFIDGLPGGWAAEIETEFLDRIEFVKGPAGTLYGSHSVGGIINRIYKRASPSRQTVLKTTFDTIGNTLQGSFDTTGPMGGGALSYRAIGVIRDGKVATGSVDNKEAIYLYASYRPMSSLGRIWTRYNYQHIETGHESPNWFYDGAGRPSSFLGADFLSVPAASYALRRNYSFEAGFETTLNDVGSTWNLRMVGRYDEQEFYEDGIVPTSYRFFNAAGTLLGSTGTAVNASQPKFSDTNWTDIRLGTATIRRAGDPDGRGDKEFGGYVDLVGDFETGMIKHKLLVYTQLSGNWSAGGGAIGYTMPPGFQFSVINPVYTDFKTLATNPVVTAKRSGSSEAFNFGIQENMFLFDDRLILVGGARYDYSQDNGALNELTKVRTAENVVNHWVYKGGIVLKPLKYHEGISLFYNYSQTFSPLIGANLAGVPFVPTAGLTNEGGVKFELLKQGIIMTASVFKNENTNFPIRVFNPTIGLDDFLQIGTGIAKGWEADIAWQPKPNLSFLVALSDVNSRSPNGTRKRNVQNGFNYRMVGKYRFTEGMLNRFSVGAAVVSMSDRAGDNNNTFITEGYETVDLFFAYDQRRWKMQLNIYNLLDGEGVESDIVASFAQVQRPRSARLSLQYVF